MWIATVEAVWTQQRAQPPACKCAVSNWTWVSTKNVHLEKKNDIVTATVKPFKIIYRTNANESGDGKNVGFCLDYMMKWRGEELRSSLQIISDF